MKEIILTQGFTSLVDDEDYLNSNGTTVKVTRDVIIK